MKICLVAGSFITGRGYQENHWADTCLKLGHDLRIIAADLEHSDIKNAVSDYELYGNKIVRIKSRGLPFSMIWSKPGIIYQELENFNPDIILLIGHPRYFGLDAFKYKRQTHSSVKLIVFNGEFADMHKFTGVHNNLSLWDHYKTLGWRILRGSVNRKGIREADIVICTKSETKDILNTLLNKTEQKIFNNKLLIAPLTYNSENTFFSEDLRSSIRSELDIKNNENLILISSRMKKDKIDQYLKPFINNISGFINQSDHLKFAFVGFINQTYSHEFELFIKQNISPNKLITLPQVNETRLNELYNAADIVVYPHHSNSAMKALGVGAYVLVTDSGSFNGQIKNTKVGLFYNVNDKSDLHNKLQQALITIKNNPRSQRVKINSWLSSEVLYGALLDKITNTRNLNIVEKVL